LRRLQCESTIHSVANVSLLSQLFRLVQINSRSRKLIAWQR